MTFLNRSRTEAVTSITTVALYVMEATDSALCVTEATASITYRTIASYRNTLQTACMFWREKNILLYVNEALASVASGLEAVTSTRTEQAASHGNSM